MVNLGQAQSSNISNGCRSQNHKMKKSDSEVVVRKDIAVMVTMRLGPGLVVEMLVTWT